MMGSCRCMASFLGDLRKPVGAKGSVSEGSGGQLDSCSLKTGRSCNGDDGR